MKGPVLKIRELRKILRSFDVEEDPSAGKGSHTVFYKVFADGRVTYPIPTSRKDVLKSYVVGCRKKFRLTPEDGVTDEDFFSRK